MYNLSHVFAVETSHLRKYYKKLHKSYQVLHNNFSLQHLNTTTNLKRLNENLSMELRISQKD